MLRCMYVSQYIAQDMSKKEDDDVTPLFHLKMYVAFDFYGVLHMKEQARQFFGNIQISIKRATRIEDLTYFKDLDEIFDMIYHEPIDEPEEGIREIIVSTIVNYHYKFNKEMLMGWTEKYDELASDMLGGMFGRWKDIREYECADSWGCSSESWFCRVTKEPRCLRCRGPARETDVPSSTDSIS